MTSPVRKALPYEFDTWFRGYHARICGTVNDDGVFCMERIYPLDDNIPEPDYNSLTDDETRQIAEEFDDASVGDDIEEFGDEDYESEDYDSDEEEFPDDEESE